MVDLDQYVRNGVFFPDHKLSMLEADLFRDMETVLCFRGFQYLSVPSVVTKETYERQGTIPWEKVFKIGEDHALAGSAEQGILEMFTGKTVDRLSKFYAKNQCFRNENKPYEGLKRLREFLKMEQFLFVPEDRAEEFMEESMGIVTGFLQRHHIKYRIVDMTEKDEGYHLEKKDVEVYTKSYGWLETHSCSYFGHEQTKRFGIDGGMTTISNTAIASPRILVPFLERG
jgi:seryl-tRNA synthetase